MRKKSSVLILISIICLSLKAQRIFVTPRGGHYQEDCEKALKKPITVYTGYDKEFDEVVKFAFEKYWKSSKIIYKNYNESEGKSNPGSSFGVGSYQTSTAIPVKYIIATWWGSKMTALDLAFDYLVKGSNENQGTDNSFHDFSNRIIQYIALVNNQINLLATIGDKEYYRYDFKGKLGTKKILISNQYIKNGISESAFKDNLSNKIEFLSADEIKSRLMADKDIDDCAELMINQTVDRITMFIIDLKSGDLLTHSNIGKSDFNKMKKVDDDAVIHLIKELKGNKP
jgi:hypothetical protein